MKPAGIRAAATFRKSPFFCHNPWGRPAAPFLAGFTEEAGQRDGAAQTLPSHGLGGRPRPMLSATLLLEEQK